MVINIQANTANQARCQPHFWSIWKGKGYGGEVEKNKFCEAAAYVTMHIVKW